MSKQERPFSQTKAYRQFNTKYFMGLTEEQARELFTKLRWGSTTVMPCTSCGTVDKHYVRKSRNQWRCKHCFTDFSVTTGTPFLNRKMSFKDILLLNYKFARASQGKAANDISSDYGYTLRTVFRTFHKIREALFETRDLTPLTGQVQADGGYFCGKPRRPRKRVQVTSAIVNNKLRNRKASIIPGGQTPNIEPWNLKKLKNRRIALVMRQIGENGTGATRTIVEVVKGENANSVIPLFKKYVDRSAEIWTDNGQGYSTLNAINAHRTVTHSVEYCTDDGVNNNQAESFFSRMRRAEYGVYNGMRHQYFEYYANEFAWRADMSAGKKTQAEKFYDVMQKIFKCGPSKAWCRYA